MAKDVCESLGISNHRDALTRLDDDEKDDVGITDTIGRTQKNSIVNESGLYKLAFTSRKEEAKRFTKWVTSEVLPTIRKTGSYTAPIEQPKPTFSISHLNQQFKEARELAFNRGFTNGKVNEAAVELLKQTTGIDLDAIIGKPTHTKGDAIKTEMTYLRG